MVNELTVALASIALAISSLVLAQLKRKANKHELDETTVSITELQQQILIYLSEVTALRTQIKELQSEVDRLANENLRLLRALTRLRNNDS